MMIFYRNVPVVRLYIIGLRVWFNVSFFNFSVRHSRWSSYFTIFYVFFFCWQVYCFSIFNGWPRFKPFTNSKICQRRIFLNYFTLTNRSKCQILIRYIFWWTWSFAFCRKSKESSIFSFFVHSLSLGGNLWILFALLETANFRIWTVYVADGSIKK